MTTDLTREQIEALKAKAADWFIITENYNGRRVSTSDQIVSSLVAVINQLEREQSAALQAPQFQPAPNGDELATAQNVLKLMEIVAKAIYASRHSQARPNWEAHWSDIDFDATDKKQAYDDARAAIEAITRLGVKGE